jgi:FAD/FMN-containing dehydrogenase
MVLPDGEIIEVGGKTLDHPGYDLTGLVVGSEGLLGIVTKVVLKIIKKPEDVKTLLASFDRIEDAGASVSGITARGVIPAGMEIMDSFCIRSVEETVGAGYPIDAGAILLVELDGPTAEVDEQMPIVEEVLKENKAIEIKVAKNTRERELFWKGRKSAELSERSKKFIEFIVVPNLTEELGHEVKPEFSTTEVYLREPSNEICITCHKAPIKKDWRNHPPWNKFTDMYTY